MHPSPEMFCHQRGARLTAHLASVLDYLLANLTEETQDAITGQQADRTRLASMQKLIVQNKGLANSEVVDLRRQVQAL